MDVTPTSTIKIIFGVHFTLVSLGIQGFWSPDSYFFYNLIFLLTILWSIHSKDNAEPVQIAIAVNLIALFLDVITLATYYPSTHSSGERFSAAMAVINLIIRPVTLFYMCRNCNQRLGLDTDNFANIFSGSTISTPGARNAYEDIGN